MQPVAKCNWYPRQFAGGHFEPGSGCCLLRLNTIGGKPGKLGCTICTGALFAWVHFLHPSGFRTCPVSVLVRFSDGYPPGDARGQSHLSPGSRFAPQ